jgi:transcriptional regulator with XRE-family HTH domain
MEPSQEGTTYSREALGARLRQVRGWCGASQKDLAAASGVSRSTLVRYENCRSEPHTYPLYRIAVALHVSLDYLLLGRNPPTEEDIAAMRLSWSLGQISRQEAATVVHLIDGILSQMPRSQDIAAG